MYLPLAAKTEIEKNDNCVLNGVETHIHGLCTL